MYLRVGIDPGKTIGIACLNLDGKLLLKDHVPFGNLEWIVNTINKTGTPLIVASDKPETSTTIKKVKAAFNARLFSPQREFKISEKRLSAKELGITNPHERDAYVAAISAYHAYANKLKQAERIANAEGSNSQQSIEEIKAKVIRKYSINEALANRKANRR